MQQDDGLGVFDLAPLDPIHGLAKGQIVDLDALVRVGGQRGTLAVAGDEAVQILRGPAGRDPKSVQRFELAGLEPDLLLQLTRRRLLRRLSRVDAARGQLQQRLGGGAAPLAHERDPALVVEGENDDRRAVFDDLARDLAAVRELEGVLAEVDDVALV